MATHIHSMLKPFRDWIRATDPHAAHRLNLLDQAGRLLPEDPSGLGDRRRALAARLERWRYQLLKEHGGNLADEDRRLSDTLDLVANELVERPSRLPRSTRASIADPRLDDGAIARGMACLDPGIPLPDVAREAAERTREHFAPQKPAAGDCPFWQIALYAPLYLSSHCINYCTYCGFRYPNPIDREHLDLPEALGQADILWDRGFRHLLLVGGDFPKLTTTSYYAEIVRHLASRGTEVAVEIAPQSTDSYAELVAAGVCGVTLYQETYDERLYAHYHTRGTKTSYDWRLEGLERAAEAGVRRLGLGVLLGLAEPGRDLQLMMRHGRYLRGRFPDRSLAFSLPRIYGAPDGFSAPHPVNDSLFLRMYCALRVAFPDATLVLSTREPACLRSRLAKTCITQLSAGSSTAPGGYQDTTDRPAGEQFTISDHRTPGEVARWLREEGFEVTWRLSQSSATSSGWL